MRKTILSLCAATFLILNSGYVFAQVVSETYEQLLTSAERGNADAQYRAAVNFYAGANGFPKDDAKAFFWANKSVEQGNSFGQWALGIMYHSGKGTAKSLEQAVFWYQKSADQNNQMAQENLAAMYQEGWGVARDWNKAAFWYKKAADQGNENAKKKLAVLEQLMSKNAGISTEPPNISRSNSGTTFVSNQQQPRNVRDTEKTITSPIGLQLTLNGEVKSGFLENTPGLPNKVAGAISYLTERHFSRYKGQFSKEAAELDRLGVRDLRRNRGYYLLNEYLVYVDPSSRVHYGVPLNAIGSVNTQFGGLHLDCESNVRCIQSVEFSSGLSEKSSITLGDTDVWVDDGVINALMEIVNYVKQKYGHWKPRVETDSYGGQKKIINTPNPNWVMDKKVRCPNGC